MPTFNTPKDELVDSVRQRRLAVIFGSGVSRQANPKDDRLSWRGLISHGIEFCSRNLEQRQIAEHSATIERFQARGGALGTEELSESAQAIEDMLGAPRSGDFRCWLATAFADCAATTNMLLPALKALPGRRLTLSYDTLLEQAFGARAISWTDKSGLLDWMRAESPDILHVHGIWSVPESMAFAAGGHARVVRDPTFQQAMKSILLSHTAVFIGCGQMSEDPHVGKFLAWTGKFLLESRYPHFKLDAGEANKVLGYDRSRNLYTIGYGSNYDDLPLYVEYLLREGKVPRPGRSDALSISSYRGGRPFVGRAQELARLRGILSKKIAIAVPVLGPPGVGKTLFVTRALDSAAIRQRFVTIARVHCDGLVSLEDVLQRLARALGYSAHTSRIALRDALSKMPSLLLFDNAESLTEPVQEQLCELIRDLLRRANVSAIVTYRGRHFPATALEWAQPIELGALAQADRRKLFLTLAGSRFGNDRSLHEVLLASGGLPIVLRNLAAAARKKRDLMELLTEYTRQPRSFIVDDRAAENGIGSAASSFRLALANPVLSAADKRLLSLVSRYPQGLCTRSIATTLGEAGVKSLRELRGAWLIEDLCEKEKVTTLPPLRHYLRLEAPAPATLIDTFNRYFVENCIREGAAVGRTGAAAAAGRITAVLDEIEMSIRELGAKRDGMAVRAATGLANYMDLTGFGSLDLLMEIADIFAADPAIAPLLERVGDVHLFRNALGRARSYFLKALELFNRTGDQARQAKCVKRLGDIAASLGESSESARSLDKARMLYREVGDLSGQARCELALSLLKCHGLELEEALHLAGAARSMFGSDLHGVGNCNNAIGYIHLLAGRISDAEVSFRKGYRLLSSLGDMFGMGISLLGVGECALALGRLEQGIEECQRARAAFRAVGRQLEEAYSILCVALAIPAEDGRLGQRDLKYAIDMAERLEDAESGGLCLRLQLLFVGTHPQVDVMAASRHWNSIGRHDLVRRFAARDVKPLVFGERDQTTLSHVVANANNPLIQP
jgi:tetratricopeptide (TPR) repeat protein